MNRIKAKEFFIIILFFILVSYHPVSAQHDADSLVNILKTFSLDDNLNIKSVEFNDSTLDFFHQAEPTYQESILPADLGNIGSAYITQYFFDRPDFYQRDFLFNQTFPAYLKKSNSTLYYNTRRPYTSIMHMTSSKVLDLQTIDFTHTQNVHPNWNLGLNYKFISSLGRNLNEKKGVNSVDISTNYKKEKYALYVSYIFNKFKSQNSGGYNDSLGSDKDEPEPLLKKSGSILYNQELSVTQKYHIGAYKNLSYKDTIIKVLEPKFSISHNLLLTRRYKVYKDEGEDKKNYYNFNFYKGSSTNDSTALQSLSNKVKFGSETVFQKEQKFGFSFIYTNNLYRFYNFKDYIYKQNTNFFNENQIKAEVFTANLPFIKAYLAADYFFTGYRKNDYRFLIDISKTLFKNSLESDLHFTAKFSNMQADYFQMRYYSNHYIWENNFSAIKRLEGTLRYEIPKYKLKAEINSALIKNYVYYDIDVVPAQFASAISVHSGLIEKTYYLKNFIFKHTLVGQYSSKDDIISLPKIGVYGSACFRANLRKTLLIHFGFDVYYSTNYKAYNYNPATGQFYFINNTKKLAGDYPYISLFADLKIKRNMLLFFKLSNLASGIISNEVLPFYVSHYPIKGRMFKFGIRWTFRN